MSRGTTILLNGTTSAGKTTVARALQETMDEPYFLSGPDHFQLAYPPGLITITDDPGVTGDGLIAVYGPDGLQDVRFGPLARQVFAGVFEAMAALSDAGLNVIIDSALSERWQLETAVAVLHDRPAYFVCIDAAQRTAELREQDRGDRGPGNVRYFYDRVYGLNDIYDLRVDAGENVPEACASIIRAVVESSEPGALGTLYRKFRGDREFGRVK